MWTVEKITALCIEYCGKAGVTFNSSVIINGRLTRTLGRCVLIQVGGVWNPTRIEISRQLLETSTDASIKAVIAHECAHYVTCAITHEHHGHDAIFKSFCKVIGADNDKTHFDAIERTKSNEEIYKYTLYCSKCGKFVGGKSRACKITQMPYNYYTKCCNAEIRVIKNW
jgi:predicted SprT family Zn-dependent metalloprotease